MEIIKYEALVAVDCDDTIVLWDNPTVDGPGKVAIPFADRTVYLVPHQYHIDLIRMYKKRGYHVTVWSANGWEHAVNVCNALKITDSVDVCQSKLTKHMDDNADAASILGPRVFCEDFTKSIKFDHKGNYFLIPDGASGGGVDLHGTFFTYPDGRKVYHKA